MPELIISWVVVGAAAGFLTYMFSRRRLRGGLAANLFVGILGALAGGYMISNTTGTDMVNGAVTWGILSVAAVAAMTTSIIFQGEAKRRPVKAKKS